MENEYKVNFISNNTVYIHGEFDDSIVELLPEIQTIIDTQKTLKEGKIIFDINSTGGKVRILIPLINLIEKSKKEGVIIETLVEYEAYSCASILACSGTTGYRYINEYAEHLCHFGAINNTVTATTLKQIQGETERSLRFHNDFEAIYKKYCEPTAQEGYIAKLFDNMENGDFFISAKECIKYGLADEIL